MRTRLASLPLRSCGFHGSITSGSRELPEKSRYRQVRLKLPKTPFSGNIDAELKNEQIRISAVRFVGNSEIILQNDDTQL